MSLDKSCDERQNDEKRRQNTVKDIEAEKEEEEELFPPLQCFYVRRCRRGDGTPTSSMHGRKDENEWCTLNK